MGGRFGWHGRNVKKAWLAVGNSPDGTPSNHFIPVPGIWYPMSDVRVAKLGHFQKAWLSFDNSPEVTRPIHCMDLRCKSRYDQGWVLAEHQIHVHISHNSFIYLILMYPSNNILLKLSITSVPTKGKNVQTLNFSFPGLVKTFPCLRFFSDLIFSPEIWLVQGCKEFIPDICQFFHTIEPILPQNSEHCNNRNQILQQSSL